MFEIQLALKQQAHEPQTFITLNASVTEKFSQQLKPSCTPNEGHMQRSIELRKMQAPIMNLKSLPWTKSLYDDQ